MNFPLPESPIDPLKSDPSHVYVLESYPIQAGEIITVAGSFKMSAAIIYFYNISF